MQGCSRTHRRAQGWKVARSHKSPETAKRENNKKERLPGAVPFYLVRLMMRTTNGGGGV